jgi:L-cystine transport system permease protein
LREGSATYAELYADYHEFGAIALFNTAFFKESFPQVLSGVPLTLGLSLASILAGIILGLLIAAIRIKNIFFFTGVSKVFVSFSRSVPLIVILYVLCYAVPQLTSGGGGQGQSGVQISPNLIAIATFGLFAGAYLSEAFRAAYYSVDSGQKEAAISVGLSSFQTFRRIIVPQAIRSCLPNFTSVFIDVIKGTSIVYNISIFEIMGKANLVGSRGYRYIEAYSIALIIYLVICFTIYIIFKRLELHLSKKY